MIWLANLEPIGSVVSIDDRRFVIIGHRMTREGEGVGAGDIRSEVYPFTETWQGTATETPATLTLNTTLANSAAFTLSGDYGFTADGEFTLA